MENVVIQFCRAEGCEDIHLPQYMSPQAAGMDLCAAVEADVVIEPGAIVLIPCGFSMALPAGYEAQVRPRSGLALKKGITIPNAPGTIDADYRGPVGVILANIGREPVTIHRNMRVAQMVIAAVARAQIELTSELGDTQRGDGGFGHTGV